MFLALLTASIVAVAPEKGAVVSAVVVEKDSVDFNPVKIEWSQAVSPAELLLEWGGSSGKSFQVDGLDKVWFVNLELGTEYRWSIRSGEKVASSWFKTSAEPPRLMFVGGVCDFRDLGGWTAAGGKKVRQNMIFRSSPVGNITPEGVSYLNDVLKIRTDIELRDVNEARSYSSSVLGEEVNLEKISFPAYEDIDDLVNAREPFSRLMAIFSDNANYPVAFHCGNGRDRTGTLAFLLLGLLGLSEEDLVREWSVSFPGKTAGLVRSQKVDRLLAYLKSYGKPDVAGNCEAYARACGVSRATLSAFRRIMLEGGAL